MPFYAALGRSYMPALYWDLNQHEALSIMISAYQPFAPWTTPQHPALGV